MKADCAASSLPTRCLRSAILFGFLGCTLATSLPSFASSSGIVGFYQVQIPAGNSAWVSGLVGNTSYEGAAVTVTADVDGKAVLTFDSPGWTNGEFNRHYAEPQSGSGAGLALDILVNTANSLKLDSTPAAAGLVDGMTLIVRKHATLAGLLPDGGGFLPFNDSLSLFGPTGSQSTYFFNSATQKWISALGADASNVVIRPGQGFVVQLASPITLVLGKGEICHVKTTATKVRANANVPNLMGALNPLGTSTTLGALGIVGSLQAFNDSVVTLNPGSLAQTGTFLSNGANFINGSGQNATNTSLAAGASVVVNVDNAKNISLTPVTASP